MEEAKNNFKKNVECVDLVKEHKNRQKKISGLSEYVRAFFSYADRIWFRNYYFRILQVIPDSTGSDRIRIHNTDRDFQYRKTPKFEFELSSKFDFFVSYCTCIVTFFNTQF